MSKVTNVLPTATEAEQRLLKALATGKIYSTITELCQDAKVDRSVWYDAIKKDYFVFHLSEGGKAVLWATFPAIVDKIAKQAKSGSFPQQKMILEMLKVYQGTPTNQVNVGVAINQTQVTDEMIEEEALDFLKKRGYKCTKT